MNSSYLPRRTAFLPPPPRPINGIYPKKEMEEWSKNNRKIIKKNFKKKQHFFSLLWKIIKKYYLPWRKV